MSVEVFDNRQSHETRPREPIIKGNVTKVHTWGGSTHIFLIIDTGYTVSLPKALVPELVKAAEEGEK